MKQKADKPVLQSWLDLYCKQVQTI